MHSIRPVNSLRFDAITPVAPQELGGLRQDHFSNGRIFATVAAHGGLAALSCWQSQHLGAQHFFRGDVSTAWNRLFRFALVIDEKRYYPVLSETRLFPFGLSSTCEAAGVTFRYDLLLLPDALVQRAEILSNPAGCAIATEVLHQEAVTGVRVANREWQDFHFVPEWNALVTSSTDQRPPPNGLEEHGLAQKGHDVDNADRGRAVTWIAASCDTPLSARRGYHPRSKHYLRSGAITQGSGNRVASYVVFATDKDLLGNRLQQLSTSVHRECDDLVQSYEARLAEARPRIRTHSPALDSAFGQYPEIIRCLALSDRPGAVRATASAYFVWGWDGMMPLLSSTLANDAAHTAAVLRFFHETRNDKLGLPHQFTTSFTARLQSPFPAQAQYLAGLYMYVALTGDTALAREVWPTCLFILQKCREHEVAGTGLVSGNALWPDFPEAMEENGHDISSMNNSMLYQGLRSMEYLAATLGEEALAVECRDWAQRLRVNFVRYLYDEEIGTFISSCSSLDFTPRKHYCAQAVFWLTPFARELAAHAPGRIADFLNNHLRSEKCLLTLPHWDTAWMADGNQLGSSFPAADSFYLGMQKMTGNEHGLKSWLGDIEWFWRYHTAPEAFTPEAENESALGPDNTGTKQLQALTTWYASAYYCLAGLDFDHEGITFNPWGSHPIEILGLRLRDVTLNIRISGEGRFLQSLSLNGNPLPAGSHKVSWDRLLAEFKANNNNNNGGDSETKSNGATLRLEAVRTAEKPPHPAIIQADGLRVTITECTPQRLLAVVTGTMSGEVAVRTHESAAVRLQGKDITCLFDEATGTFRVSFPAPSADVQLLEVLLPLPQRSLRKINCSI